MLLWIISATRANSYGEGNALVTFEAFKVWMARSIDPGVLQGIADLHCALLADSGSAAEIGHRSKTKGRSAVHRCALACCLQGPEAFLGLRLLAHRAALVGIHYAGTDIHVATARRLAELAAAMLVRREARARRDQSPDDDVLLQARADHPSGHARRLP